jgi:hypothetical protein
MYQDLAPINSLVVSVLDPATYYADVTTKPSKFFRFPGMCFVELGLGPLARDPENGQEGDLPYSFLLHLREALLELQPGSKQNKLVGSTACTRFGVPWYRMVKDGFYLGIGEQLVHYPMLSHEVLRKDSQQLVAFGQSLGRSGQRAGHPSRSGQPDDGRAGHQP